MKLPRLKEVRELHGWSQKKLAEESGVSRDSISNYETGQRDAWPATAKKLADALDAEISDLREPARELALPKAEAPDAGRAAGHSFGRVSARREEAIEKFEQELEQERYAPAAIAQGWHQLAQRWSKRLETGAFDVRSLEDLMDTLEDVALGMEANVATERRELSTRYDEGAVRNMTVLRPAINRLSQLVGEILREIDARKAEAEQPEQPEDYAALTGKVLNIEDHLNRMKRAS